MSYATAVRVHQFRHVIYPAIYTKIDMDYASVNGGVKCYYEIKPGGNPADIKMTFGGATSYSISGNDILISNPVENFLIPQATAFQIDASGNYISLAWQPSYTINGSGQVIFSSLGTYDATKVLVFAIQYGKSSPPISTTSLGNIEASTFCGGSIDEVFYDVAKMVPYHVAVGSTRSMPFPGTQGTYFQNLYGTTDAFMASFNASNASLHAYSIMGGNGEDVFLAAMLDYADVNAIKIIFAGYSASPGMVTFPYSSPGYYQTSKQGYQDAFIGNINYNFTYYPWSTYMGGPGNEEIDDLSYGQNCIYFTGTGDSLSPIRTQTHSYNSSNGSLMIGRFDLADSLVWCTMFGSGRGHSLSKSGKRLAVVGESVGSNLPIVTPSGAYYKGFPDSTDAIIARFNEKDSVVWSTYYGGTYLDQAKGCVIDHNGNVWVTGITRSSDFEYYFPNTNVYRDSTYAGGSDAFMCRFDTIGHRQWATYFGGSNYDGAEAVDVDYYNDIFFFGYSTSNNMYTQYATGLYNQSTLAGNPLNTWKWGDGFITMFKPNAQIAWSTYFGGNMIDGIRGASIDNSYLNMAIVGYAGSFDSTSFPIAGPGAKWYNAGYGNDDGFYTRMGVSNIWMVSVPEQVSTLNSFLLYPNPGNGELWVNFGMGIKPEQLTVTNALGQIVYQQKVTEASDGLIKIDLTSFADGVYFLNLSFNGGSETQKFTIAK